MASRHPCGAAVFRPGTGTTARYVGAEIDLLATYNFTRHLLGYVGYSHFFPGEFHLHHRGTRMNDVAARSVQLTRLRRLLSSIAVPILLSITSVVPAVAQQFPEVPLYELLPPNYPYPLARVCYTQAGICDVPTYVFPGAPCACQGADGVWISGVVTH
jgi:hypothetical protein